MSIEARGGWGLAREEPRTPKVSGEVMHLSAFAVRVGAVSNERAQNEDSPSFDDSLLFFMNGAG